MAAWTPKTLADEGTTGLVKCSCGRTVWPDMMVDVSALAAAVRGSATHLCDACRERMIRSKKIARADFVSALGAPQAVVQKMKARGA